MGPFIYNYILWALLFITIIILKSQKFICGRFMLVIKKKFILVSGRTYAAVS